jgi:hypothetical protein
MIQIGNVSAKMWGFYMPALVLTTQPDIPDNEETNNWSFVGEALAVNGNDELYVAAA